MAGLTALPAKSIDLPDEKMHFDIPDDWVSSQVQIPAAVFYAANAQNTTVCVLIAMPNDDQEGLDQPSFISGFKDGMLKQMAGQGGTATVTHEGPLTIDEVPFYLFQGVFKMANGNTLNFRAYVSAVNGKIYGLILESLDATADSQFEGVANSITFQGTPVLPDPSLRKEDTSTAYKVGQLFGYVIGVLAMLVTGRWLLKLVRRRSGSD
jgi:hypothetical protein